MLTAPVDVCLIGGKAGIEPNITECPSRPKADIAVRVMTRAPRVAMVTISRLKCFYRPSYWAAIGEPSRVTRLLELPVTIVPIALTARSRSPCTDAWPYASPIMKPDKVV